MSDTAAMTALHPSHIPRLLEEGLDDLVFVHVYVFPLFIPFLYTEDIEVQKDIVRLANIAFMFQKKYYRAQLRLPCSIWSYFNKSQVKLEPAFSAEIQRDTICFT